MVNRAFIIGNGLSRKDFDLTKLDNEITFGCNALYRDYNPTWLVAIDEKIIKEIYDSDWPDDKFIVPPQDEQFEPAEYNPVRPRSNAGMNAMQEAIKMGYEELFCLGFDFIIQESDYILGNIYDGTNAYGPETKTSIPDSIKRLNYLSWFADQNPSVDFYFLFDSVKYNLQPIMSENCRGMYYDDLQFI